MYFVGKIDVGVYSCVCSEIITDEVIITRKQIDHILERPPEKEHAHILERLGAAVEYPDYILADQEPNTAVVFKQFQLEVERYRVIIKLATAADDRHPKNSIITAFYISEKKEMQGYGTPARSSIRSKEQVYLRVFLFFVSGQLSHVNKQGSP